VLWPSADRTQVVYENGGFIYRFDSATQKTERSIRVYGDFRNTRPPRRDLNIEELTSTERRACVVRRARRHSPSPRRKRFALTQTPGIRERDASWSPDGKWIALSDKTGDYEDLRPSRRQRDE
jgi:tricorn protease